MAILNTLYYTLLFPLIIPPSDRFYADPFCASENGRHFIFIEE